QNGWLPIYRKVSEWGSWMRAAETTHIQSWQPNFPSALGIAHRPRRERLHGGRRWRNRHVFLGLVAGSDARLRYRQRRRRHVIGMPGLQRTVAEAGSNHRNLDLLLHAFILHRAEDDVGFV